MIGGQRLKVKGQRLNAKGAERSLRPIGPAPRRKGIEHSDKGRAYFKKIEYLNFRHFRQFEF